MNPIRSGRLLSGLSLALVLLSTPVRAQPNGAASRADPLDPKASVPALRYESSLARYRSLGDESRVGWREANDTVTRIGGWRVYLREAQQPDAAPAPASSPASSPASPGRPAAGAARPTSPAATGGHGGHGAHGGHKTP